MEPAEHSGGGHLRRSPSPDRSLYCRSGASLSSSQDAASCSPTCLGTPLAQDALAQHLHKRFRGLPRHGSAIELSSTAPAQAPASALRRSESQQRVCDGGRSVLWRPTRSPPARSLLATRGTSLCLAHALTEGPACPHQRQAVCALQFRSEGDSSVLLTARVKKALHIHRVTHCGGELSLRRVAAHDTSAKLSCAEWCPWLHSGALIGDHDGVVGLVCTATGQLLAEIDEHGGHRVRCVRSTPAGGGIVASAAGDGLVKLWGGRHLESAVGTLQAPRAHGQPLGLAWRAGRDEQLVTTSDAGIAALWDVRCADAPVCSWQAHEQACAHVNAMPDGSVVTGAANGCVRVWGGVGGTGGTHPSAEYAVGGASSALTAVAIRRDGALATSAMHDGVHVCSAERGVLVLQTLAAAGVQATSVAWGEGAGGAHLLAVGGTDGRAHVMQIAE